jgi:isopentenyl diphosphate isomerase/L-lactate dehydrogenase-like FMN-dependent dehydrogenase
MSKFPKEFAEIERIALGVFEARGGRPRVWTHKQGGAESGSAFHRSVDKFSDIGFRMRAINEAFSPDTSTTLLGQALAFPLGVAPMSAAIASVCDNAFVQMAEGSRRASVLASCGFPTAPGVLPGMVSTGAPTFRVIKPLRDIEKLVAEIQSAEKAGAIAIGLDVDSVAGLKPTGDEPHYGDLCRVYSVADLREARRATSLPFMVKGIMSVEDASAALESGADVLVVSSHAGFAMDYVQAPIEVLPAIRKAAGQKTTILLDSGIRRGSDILKALALGADGVLIGRLALWGLALGGAEGLAWVIGLLHEELSRMMVLSGVKTIDEIGPDCLVPLSWAGEAILRRCS